MTRQGQSAGDDSAQALAGRDATLTIVNGWSEEAALQAIDAAAVQAVAGYATMAREQAYLQASNFAKVLVGELMGAGQIQVLADPRFFHFVQKACISASITSEQVDHDLLARLVTKCASASERRAMGALDRAAEVIPLLDPEDLSTLTCYYAETRYWLGEVEDLREGLESLNVLYGRIMENPLPRGTEWLDQLEINNCVRVVGNGFGGGRMPWINYFTSVHEGLACAGVLPEELQAVEEALTLPGARQPVRFVPHRLRAGYLRPAYVHMGMVSNLLQQQGESVQVAEHVQAVLQGDYRFSTVNESVKQEIGAMVDNYPNVAAIRAWWDSIPHNLEVTAVGDVIATTNLQRMGLIPPPSENPAAS